VRVMVEGRDRVVVERLAATLADAVRGAADPGASSRDAFTATEGATA
jgi:hypothetical protein